MYARNETKLRITSKTQIRTNLLKSQRLKYERLKSKPLLTKLLEENCNVISCETPSINNVHLYIIIITQAQEMANDRLTDDSRVEKAAAPTATERDNNRKNISGFNFSKFSILQFPCFVLVWVITLAYYNLTRRKLVINCDTHTSGPFTLAHTHTQQAILHEIDFSLSFGACAIHVTLCVRSMVIHIK